MKRFFLILSQKKYIIWHKNIGQQHFFYTNILSRGCLVCNTALFSVVTQRETTWLCSRLESCREYPTKLKNYGNSRGWGGLRKKSLRGRGGGYGYYGSWSQEQQRSTEVALSVVGYFYRYIKKFRLAAKKSNLSILQ